jgi:hypothetical protein
MVLALAMSCAGFVSPMAPSRAVAAMSRGPATFSMQVKGLGGNSDQRPIEMIHADADAAFKMLDEDNGGSIDNEKLRKYLYTRDYSPELVDKVFAGIDVDKGGDIDADVMPACGKCRHASVACDARAPERWQRMVPPSGSGPGCPTHPGRTPPPRRPGRSLRCLLSADEPAPCIAPPAS